MAEDVDLVDRLKTIRDHFVSLDDWEWAQLVRNAFVEIERLREENCKLGALIEGSQEHSGRMRVMIHNQLEEIRKLRLALSNIANDEPFADCSYLHFIGRQRDRAREALK